VRVVVYSGREHRVDGEESPKYGHFGCSHRGLMGIMTAFRVRVCVSDSPPHHLGKRTSESSGR